MKATITFECESKQELLNILGENKQPKEVTPIISPYFEDGEFKGARVCTGGEDFVIAPHDCEWGRMKWSDTMDALKERNLTTWNYRQICLTMAFRKEVDEVLTANGGEALTDYYWTCAEYSASYSFTYYGYLGYLYNLNKTTTFSCRPVLALD